MIKELLSAFPIRRVSRGVEIWYRHRISTSPYWRNKQYPYWFKRKYPDGTRTLQIMRFEYWYWPHRGRNS